MNELDLMHKFHSKLPIVRNWIDKTLEENQDRAVPIIDLSFSKLNKVFPVELLTRAKIVVVKGKVPFPPLSSMDLPEFAQMENMPMTGVTYKDTFFVNEIHQTESLYFHEIVHIVQWDRLGIDDFLLVYGAGLVQFGYRDSPLEKMAYSLQYSFDHSALPVDIVEQIQKKTDDIWNELIPFFSKV